MPFSVHPGLGAARSFAPAEAGEGGGGGGTLLASSDLTYLGAFRVPAGSGTDAWGDAYGMLAGNVLYEGGVPRLLGSGYEGNGYVTHVPSLSKISVPLLKDPGDVTVAGLNTATEVQPFVDPVAGNGPLWITVEGTPTTTGAGGACAFVVLDGNIIVTGQVSYPTAPQSYAAAVNVGTDLTSLDAAGPYVLLAEDPDWGALPQGLYGGYACLIPTDKRSDFGDMAVLCGAGMRSIASEQSNGPTLMVIDADAIAAQPADATVIDAFPLAYYYPQGTSLADPLSRHSLGVFNSNSTAQTYQGDPIPTFTITDPAGQELPPEVGTGGPVWTVPLVSETMQTQGVFWPEGFDTVGVLIRKGLGPNAYGPGTATAALHGTDAGGGFNYVYDPVIGAQGPHEWPYCLCLALYDATELAASFADPVANPPWLNIPYSVFALDMLYGADSGLALCGAVSHDPALRRLYISVPYLDGTKPVIQVLEYAGGGAAALPTLAEASHDGTSVTLTLTAPATGAVSGFKVYRDAVLIDTLTNGPYHTQAVTYTDTGLAFETAYSYTLKAWNADGDSSATAAVVVTTNAEPEVTLLAAVAEADGPNSTTTTAIDTTGADLIVVVDAWYGGGPTPTVTDSKSNGAPTASTTYGTAINGARIRISYWAAPATVGSGHTFTVAGTGSYAAAVAAAFSGIHATPADNENGAESASASTLATGSITPSVDYCLVVTAVETNIAGTPTCDSGFTPLANVDWQDGVALGVAAAYKLQTTAAAVNPTWSLGGAANTAAAIRAFKPA
jgi:hypothetical protein